MNKLVTIITPSFNQADFLEETILSVLNQSYPKIEYIIIDGGSWDFSVKIIKRYEDRIAYWISERDEGQANAINKGFYKSTGDFICWLNSDDILYPDFVKNRLQQFEQNKSIDMIYGDVDQGDSIENTWIRRGRHTDFRNIIKSLSVPIPQQSAMWRRRVFDITGFLDPQWHVLLDMDYFIRISKNHKILYIPGSVGFFRVHPKSKSINEATKWAEELPLYYRYLINKWEDYKKCQHSVMAKCFWYCGSIYSEKNDFEKAKFYFIKAKTESIFTVYKLLLIQLIVKVKKRIKLICHIFSSSTS